MSQISKNLLDRFWNWHLWCYQLILSKDDDRMKGKDYLSNSLISWSFHKLETMGRLKMTYVFFVLKPQICERVVRCTNNNNLKTWKLKQWLKTILIWTFLPVFYLFSNFVILPECRLLVKKAHFTLKISSFSKICFGTILRSEHKKNLSFVKVSRST
jgi:hypothetical protein